MGPALLLTGLGCCPGYHELLLPSLNPTANRVTGKRHAGEEEENTNLKRGLHFVLLGLCLLGVASLVPLLRSCSGFL